MIYGSYFIFHIKSKYFLYCQFVPLYIVFTSSSFAQSHHGSAATLNIKLNSHSAAASVRLPDLSEPVWLTVVTTTFFHHLSQRLYKEKHHSHLLLKLFKCSHLKNSCLGYAFQTQAFLYIAMQYLASP